MKKIIEQIVEYVKEPHNVHLCGLPSGKFRTVVDNICKGGLGRNHKIVEIDLRRLLLKDPDSRWDLGLRIAKKCSASMGLKLGELAKRRCTSAEDFRDSLDEFSSIIKPKLGTTHGIVFLWRHFDQILRMDESVQYDLYCTLSPLIMDSEVPMVISSYIPLRQIQQKIGYGDNTDLARRFVERGMIWVKPDEEGVSEPVNAHDYDRWRKILQGLSDAIGRSYMDVVKGIVSGEGQQPSQMVDNELRGYGLLDGDGVSEWARYFLSHNIANVTDQDPLIDNKAVGNSVAVLSTCVMEESDKRKRRGKAWHLDPELSKSCFPDSQEKRIWFQGDQTIIAKLNEKEVSVRLTNPSLGRLFELAFKECKKNFRYMSSTWKVEIPDDIKIETVKRLLRKPEWANVPLILEGAAVKINPKVFEGLPIQYRKPDPKLS